MDKLSTKLSGITGGIDHAVEAGVQQIVKKGQTQAKNLVAVNMGELRESIKTRFDFVGEEKIGEVFTNKSYAPYVEFGTGPNGQASSPALPDGVSITYSQTGWIIPASAMSEEMAAGYGFGILKNKDGAVIGYATNGQRAQPYMVPASNYAHEIAPDEIKKAVQKALRGS